MILRFLLSLFTREENAAEQRDRFYNGHPEARKWAKYGTRVAGSQILHTSRHGL